MRLSRSFPEGWRPIESIAAETARPNPNAEPKAAIPKDRGSANDKAVVYSIIPPLYF